MDHDLIDRRVVAPLLLELTRCTTETGSGGRTRGEARKVLDAFADSSLERQFLQWLDDGGYRLPDRAQVTVDAARARPDLVFDLPSGQVAVFVDGPVHDSPHQAERDAAAQERLRDLGWSALRVRYDDDWNTHVSKYETVYGPGRGR
jgi:hypothetical protein